MPQRGNSGVGVIPKEIHTLNDAILAAGKSLSTRPQGSRRIVYVISDGKESRSKANFREVVHYLESQPGRRLRNPGGRFRYLGLGYLDKIKIPLLPLSPDNILPRYTAATGGHLYSEFSENGIQRSFAELAALARTQYTIGYYSRVPVLDGKYRTIEVDVTAAESGCHCQEGILPDCDQPLSMMARPGEPGLNFIGLGLAASVFWGASDFLGGLATRKAHVATVVAIAHGLSLATFGPAGVGHSLSLPHRTLRASGALRRNLRRVGPDSLLPSLIAGRDGPHHRPHWSADGHRPDRVFVCDPGFAEDQPDCGVRVGGGSHRADCVCTGGQTASLGSGPGQSWPVFALASFWWS